MPELRALPGRVVLEFAPPVEKVGSIIVSEGSQLRPEFGAIRSIGEPLNDEDRKIALELMELQRQGKKIAVSFAAGTSYWRNYDVQALGPGDWNWLKNAKTYRLGELAAYVEE